MELLIVIALIGVLAVAALALFNPKKQMEKAWDGQRKTELATLSKVFEDFYNDNSSYPTANDVCYSEEQSDEPGKCYCYICGNESTTSNFNPYLSRLPCDPQHPSKRYLYQYDCEAGSWFKTFAYLSTEDSQGGYNWGVASPNTSVGPFPTIIPTSTPGPTSIPTSVPTATDTPLPSTTSAPPSPTPTNPPPTPTSVYPTCPANGIHCYITSEGIPQCQNCGTRENCDNNCDSQLLELYNDEGGFCVNRCSP